MVARANRASKAESTGKGKKGKKGKAIISKKGVSDGPKEEHVEVSVVSANRRRREDTELRSRSNPPKKTKRPPIRAIFFF